MTTIAPSAGIIPSRKRVGLACHRGGHGLCRRLGGLFVGGALSLGSLQAQWLTQTFTLKPGWNAIYTHVDASYQSLDSLIPDANGPVAEIWLWKPTFSTIQFVDSPYTNSVANSQWGVWTSARADADTLTTLVGNGAYLVNNRTSSDYVWTVKGKPVPPRYQWTTTGLNFLGFPTPSSTAPSFANYLSPAPGLDLAKSLQNQAHVFRYPGGNLGATNPAEVVSIQASTTAVNRGQAFWVRGSTDYYNHYYGPVEVGFQNPSGMEFQDNLGTYAIRLKNVTSTSRTVRLDLVSSETPPTGQSSIVGTPQLLGGQNGPELILTNAAPSDSGRYEAWVSNVLGTARSEAAVLMVLAGEFNDDFESRILIPGISNTVRGSILGATKQPGEPHHGGEVGGRSVWWSWEAPSDGMVEINTLGSTVDTLLGVYAGEAVDRLTKVAENDDMVPDLVFASRVVFQAMAGQRYHIAVDASKTRTPDGTIVLTVRPPASLQQRIEAPVVLSDGRTRLSWSDVEGIASGEANRFEVEYTTNLDSEPVVWLKHPAPVLLRNGRFVFEDATVIGQTGRFYRVTEKTASP